MDVINTRRSVRKYNDKVVEKEKVMLILKAAMQAPSAKNQKPWEFLVVSDKNKLTKCASVLPNTKMLETAAFAIVFMTNKIDLVTPLMYPQDLSSSVTCALLKARELNVGSCWCGIYPHEERMNKIREVFDIKESYLEPFAVVSFGYPEDEEAFKFVDRYNEKLIHFEEI